MAQITGWRKYGSARIQKADECQLDYQAWEAYDKETGTMKKQFKLQIIKEDNERNASVLYVPFNFDEGVRLMRWLQSELKETGSSK